MKYAVVSSNFHDYFYPFGECLPVIRETKSSVYLDRGNGRESRKSKSNILFYCDVDITDALKEQNRKVKVMFDKHVQFSKEVIEEIKSIYSIK